MNVDTNIIDTALAGVMAAGIVMGLLAGMAYVPYMALAVSGLVWYFLCRRTVPRLAVGYVVLGACALLAVSTYNDAKHIIYQPDVVGVVCMAAGLTGLVVVFRWAVSRVPARGAGFITDTAE